MPDPREQAEAVWRKLFPWPETQCPVCGFTYSDRPTGCKPRDCSLRPVPSRKASDAPPLESSLDAMREVEDEIERRGLMDEYILKLAVEVGVVLVIVNAPEPSARWRAIGEMARATAVQRLQAAYMVIKEVGSAG